MASDVSGRIAHRFSIMSLAANNGKLYYDKNHMSVYLSYNVDGNGTIDTHSFDPNTYTVYF